MFAIADEAHIFYSWFTGTYQLIPLHNYLRGKTVCDALWSSYGSSNTLKFIGIAKVGYNMLSIEHGVNIIYSSFTSSHTTIALHYDLWEKIVSNVFEWCYTSYAILT